MSKSFWNDRGARDGAQGPRIVVGAGRIDSESSLVGEGMSGGPWVIARFPWRHLAGAMLVCVMIGWSATEPCSTGQVELASGCEIVEGAVVRGPVSGRRIALVFTGHEFAEGGTTILDGLRRHRARASFFLTGDFLANPEFEPLVRRLVAEGHYLGPHSDKHLLYCDWSPRKTRLVSRETFEADLRANLVKIARLTPERPAYFLPPYEHHDAEIARWTAALGMRLVNFTPGTRSNADYTEDAARNFVTSETIYDSIVRRERDDPHGLNGFLLLLHIGAGPLRTDKFADRFGELLDHLAGKDYHFVRVDELLEPETKP
jgi:peptidoglycan/xylan/chitin deacetylase (PgdA/CDA1 family)